MKKINPLSFSIKILIIFCFLFISQTGQVFALFGRKVPMLTNDWKDSNKNQAARYNLDPRGESCGLGSVVGDMAYQFDEAFEVSNDQGENNLFYNPKISLRHAYEWWYPFYYTCLSYFGGKSTFSVKKGRTACYKTGVMDSRKICVTTLPAPRNRRDLYIRLANIQTGGDVNKAKTTHLKAVLQNDQDAINSGFCDFKDITLPWLSIVKANPEKFIAKYPGQEMICAFDITSFIWISGQDRCKNPQDCASNLKDLIKCLLLPMGPAPKPFAPFIMGEEKVSLVFDENSSFSKPIARVVIYRVNQKFQQSFNLFDSSGKVINKSDHNFNVQFINQVNGGPEIKNNNYNFEFEVDEIGRQICGSLKSINGEILDPKREIGCIPLAGEIRPELEKIESSSGTPPLISLKNLNSDLKTKPLKPISLEKLNLLIESGTQGQNEIYLEPETNKYISSFRSNFHPNPYNFKNRFIVKKLCNYVDQNFYRNEVHENLNHKCEDSPGFSSGKINLFRCTVDGEIVDQINKCQGSIGVNIKGYKCNNGKLIEENEFCDEILKSFNFEDDYAGNAICLRNIDSFFKENRSYLIPKELKNKKYFHFFGENGHVLIPLSKTGSGELESGPNNFKKFSDFTQAQLDSFFHLYDQVFAYTFSGNDTNFSYQRAFYNKTFAGGQQDLDSKTILSDSDGPFFIENEKFKDDILEADPISQGMCLELDSKIPEKKWNYTLQFPIYYSNYDISTHQTDLIYRNDLKFKKIDGIFDSKDPKISSEINFNDQEKKNILLVSTKVKPIDPASTDPKLAKLGVSSELLGDTIEFDNTKFSASNTKFFENFNVWEDYVESLKSKKEIFYTDGTDLLNSGQKFFDTSGCNLIEFEIYSGGSSSEAELSSDGTKNFMNEPVKLPFCKNGGHAGSNGGYVKGSFMIRPNSNLIIKVGGPNGNLSKRFNGADEFKNSDDFSAIWVKENGENNELIGTSKPKLMIKVDSGGVSHFCADPSKCANLKIEEIHSKILSNSDKNIFQLDNESFSQINFGNQDPRRSFPLENFEKFNQEIGITEFRGANFSSVCGKTSVLKDTLPLSFPVILNKYNDYGIVSEKFIPDFKKQTGTGNFNKIGSYFYSSFSDSSKPFGETIDWSKRNEYNQKFEEICRPALEVCFTNSSSIPDGSVMKGNLANDSSFMADPTKKTADDLNFYCPGLGGCYFSSNQKAMSNSGTAGLVKISCKKYEIKLP